jgi:hypothetical protein
MDDPNDSNEIIRKNNDKYGVINSNTKKPVDIYAAKEDVLKKNDLYFKLKKNKEGIIKHSKE